MNVCVCVYVREREKKREKERERECVCMCVQAFGQSRCPSVKCDTDTQTASQIMVTDISTRLGVCYSAATTDSKR